MKLRIRYEKKTKVINISEDPTLNLGVLKLEIRENVLQDLGLDPDNEFQISLDGRTSAGEDSTLLKDAGIVSGDLLKILFGSIAPSRTQSNETFTVEAPGSSPVEACSAMSVTPSDEAECSHPAGPSSSVAIDDIPCMSPGPIFFQDCANSSQVPHLLQQLYENDSVKTEFQALCIALHFMMSESGFYIEDHVNHHDILPLLSTHIFNVEYVHPAGDNLKFNLTCNPLGSFILVNGVAHPCQNTNEQVLTLQIKKSDYVIGFDASNKNSNAAAVYQNLSKLARIFKETVSYPAINNMREELQLPPVNGLLSLFPELLLRICSNLDHRSLSVLSQVCQRLSDICSDDTLWRNLYIRDFKSHPTIVDSSWKSMYSRKFVRDKETRREMERRYRESQTMDPWPQFPTPGYPSPVPFPDQPFGMLGGEHDLNPAFPYGPFGNQPRNPRRFPPTHPVHPMNPDNPLPGSRFDPIYPGGGFRPGRGGGMMDSDMDGFGGPGLYSNRNQGRNRGRTNRFGFM